MAKVQSYFEQFHDAIKMDDENEILREKRDILIDKLRAKLKENFEEPPVFTSFNKGSYSMDLGTKPIDQDYDIDVGLEFIININDYPDPVVVKKWVYNALYGHTDNVKIKKPCVTVQYHLNKEPLYHVDFAVYGSDLYSTDIYLARGKPTSPDAEKKWEVDDPKGLIKIIRGKYADKDDQKQFRRVIRYLKRWKDINFSSEGREAPPGIGLTVSANNWFSISKTLIDPLKLSYEYDDLSALLNLVNSMISNFQVVPGVGQEVLYRLYGRVPVQPYSDTFAKMSDIQMTNFKKKLEGLRDVLTSAKEDVDPVDACKKLQKQFGSDFLIPNIEETGQKRGPAIISSSSAA